MKPKPSSNSVPGLPEKALVTAAARDTEAKNMQSSRRRSVGRSDTGKIEPANEARAPAPATSVPIQPRWDDSAAQEAYANVCNVLGSREEVTLLFGTNQTWQSGSPTVDVNLSHRIVLTPYTAKRLAQMLAQGVREYEARFGAITLK